MNYVAGLPLIFGAIALLVWNENHHVHAVRLFAEAGANLTELLDTTRIDPANEGKLLHYGATARAGKAVSDPLFGFGGHFLGVERKVEYYQWVEHQYDERRKDENGTYTVTHYEYVLEWSPKPVDSEKFQGNAPRNNKNTTLLVIDSHKTYSQGAKFGPYLMHPELIDSIQPMKTDLEFLNQNNRTYKHSIDSLTQHGKIPHHLFSQSVYFGEYPSSPEVGDVRVTFIYRGEGKYFTSAQAHGDTLQPYRCSDGYWLTYCRFTPTDFDPSEDIAFEIWGHKWLVWSLRIIGWLMLVGGIKQLLGVVRRLVGSIPVLGTVARIGINLFSWVFGTLLAVTTIAVTFVVLRPWLGLTILGALVLSVVLYHLYYRRKHPVVPPPIPPLPPSGLTP